MTVDAAPSGERHVELFARAAVPPAVRDRQSSVAERLADLAAEDHVASVETHTWPGQVPLNGAGVPDRYGALAAWADERDITLEPFFETRERRCLGSERRETVLVLPVLSLAVFEGDDLRAVYPHATGDGVRTVDDGLAALTDGVAGEPRSPVAAGD